MTNQKKGFTLIELLVVIAIIGILSAIGLVSLNGAREKARDAQRKSDVGQMNTALVLYYDDHSSTYPAQVAAPLSIDCIDSGGTAETVTFAGVVGAAAPTNIWGATGGVIGDYLSAGLTPPGGGSDFQDLYCYDTNDAHATLPDSAYVMFTGLEGGDGTAFFTINSDGETGTAQPTNECTTADTCTVS